MSPMTDGRADSDILPFGPLGVAPTDKRLLIVIPAEAVKSAAGMAIAIYTSESGVNRVWAEVEPVVITTAIAKV